MSNRDGTPSISSIILIGVGFIAGVLILGLALGWFSLFTDRSMQKYREETRAQVYDDSRQYNQGTNRDIARYCEQMRDTTRPLASRKAVAGLIRSTMSTYEGRLTEDNIDCVSEAKGF